MKLEANLRPDSPGKKTSSIRNLFRKSQIPTPPQSSSDHLHAKAMFVNRITGPIAPKSLSSSPVPNGHKQQDSIGSNNAGPDYHLLGELIRRVSDQASKKDLSAVKRESDEFLGKPPSHFRMPKQHHVRIQALSSPEGVIVTDVRGITRVLNDHAKDELTSGIKNMPALSWARAKVRILSTRADLSSEQGDLADALWCYEQLLEFVTKFPAIFPGEVWHTAILANLADLAEKSNNPAQAETYYLRALDSSYSRRGRYDNDNVKLLQALAELCKNTGHPRGAAELFSRVLRRYAEIGGLESKETLVAMQDLAAVHAKLGNLQAARNLYEKSLEGLEATSSLDDQTMLSVMNALCDIYVQLNHADEANALALRALPAMRLVLGPDHSLTRATLLHYFEYVTNFDFNEHIEALLQDYREHHTDGGLWVLQGLARAYSLAGLQHDAARTFKSVWEARTALQGPQEYGTLDALQGWCLALEFMDDIDRATHSYTHLLQMSSRTPLGHEARKRINPTRSRLASLRVRRNSLEEEKIAWGQHGLGYCSTCKQMTNSFCLSCQFFRFCSEECRDRSGSAHKAACHPSISLCESKSVSTADSVPARISQMAVETVQARDIRLHIRTRVYKIAGAFALSLDARRFATFRVKLSSPVDTFLMFEKEADMRYAIVDVTPEPGDPRASISSISQLGDASFPFKWFTPQEQPVLVVPSGREVYLLVAPGQEMLNAIVAKRQATRRRDSAHWSGMTIPTFECVTYCQGLVVDKKEWQRFAYLVEVES
jgi:tetratricopeptide (TPR) repeat protein